MRRKEQPTSRTASLTPTSVFTLDHLPFDTPTGKERSSRIKATIPIKQYTNKFFRQTGCFKNISSTAGTTKINHQKRFNVLMKKKQMISKQLPKQELRIKSEACEEPQRTSVITIKGYPASKLRKRAVTEVQTENNCESILQQTPEPQNPQSSILELQQELVISSLLEGPDLTPSYSSFLKNHTQNMQNKSQHKTELRLKEAEIGKISQSRGLELFSKLYVKEKSAMVEKLRESSGKIKKTTIHREVCTETENMFETKKIYPIQKNSKREHLLRSLDKKRNIPRTPMRTIENRHIQSRGQTLSRERLQEDNQVFQIRGWDTTL